MASVVTLLVVWTFLLGAVCAHNPVMDTTLAGPSPDTLEYAADGLVAAVGHFCFVSADYCSNCSVVSLPATLNPSFTDSIHS